MTAWLEGLFDGSGPIAVTTLGDLLVRAARQHGDHDALVMPGLRLTYRDLLTRALQRARGLMALGVKGGDHVAILLPASAEFVEFLFGIALAGAVPVPMNARYRGHEMRYLVENSDAIVVVTTGSVAQGLDLFDRLKEGLGEPVLANGRLSLPGLPRLKQIVHLGDAAPGTVSAAGFDERAATVKLAAVLERRAQVRVRDTGLLLYTSGTTANPKGCLLSHEALVRNGIELARRYRMTEADSFWSPLPLFHIAGIMPLIATAWSGARYVTMPVFDAGAALRQIADERVSINYACLAPIMADLINHPDFAATDFSSMRMMNSSFALLPPSFGETLQATMGHTLHVSTYGMSECAGTVTTSRLDDPADKRMTRLGTPFPGMEVKAISEEGAALPPGETGELVIRGYGTCDGYHRDPVKSAEALRGGWFHTGDVGSVDAEGHVLFTGRLKDMLKVGGENVAALEIESFIGTHPAVKLCQVVGMPHDRLVEVPAAFVELRPGMSATEDEIIAFCTGRIARFKVPRLVRFVTEWPMSASKIQKFRLRDSLLSAPA